MDPAEATLLRTHAAGDYAGIADCYCALSLAYSAFADNAKDSAAHEKTNWREARICYQKSLDIWSEKRARGSLDNSETETAERAAEGVARCDVVLAKLGGSVR